MLIEKLERFIRKIMQEQALPCLGKVEKTFSDSGKYFADIRQLDNEKNNTATIYKNVKIPKMWGAENSGIWMTPSKNAIVILNFLNGDRNYPIISSILGNSLEIEHPENELIIKQGDMELRLSDKITLRNAHASLGDILADISDKISNLKTIGAPSPHTINPAQITEWKLLKETKIKKLFK
ncbi:MAG: hypothetical protein ACRC9L_02090 [Brevinema sp.]